MRKKCLGFIMFFPLLACAQIGGQSSYEFLNIPVNPRLVALGGVNVSIANEDVNLAFSNPALNGDTLSGMASFAYLDYFADVSVVSAIYQHDFGKYGPWFFGVTHVGYGEVDSFDPSGAALGTAQAAETLISLGTSHNVGLFTMGATLKFINSGIAGFNSNALAIDLGGAFVHPNKQLSFGLVFKNVGFVLSDYSETSSSELPFDLQAGMTFKPKFMPFRFSFTGYNLTQGDISYFDPNSIDFVDEPGTFDNIFRHVNIGAELLLSKNINVRLGYNHLVRQELKLEETGGGAGFSFGLMFRVKAFEFSYSRGGYHAAGGSNSFSVTANTNTFFKKRQG